MICRFASRPRAQISRIGSQLLLWLGHSSTGPSLGTFSSPSTRMGCRNVAIGFTMSYTVAKYLLLII